MATTRIDEIYNSLRWVEFDLDVYPDDMGTSRVAEKPGAALWLNRFGWVDLTLVRLWFSGKGVEISGEALEHNFSAWMEDRKSGYRDEEHGWFLFTPCGCNTLSFRAQELSSDPDCDWQETYEC